MIKIWRKKLPRIYNRTLTKGYKVQKKKWWERIQRKFANGKSALETKDNWVLKFSDKFLEILGQIAKARANRLNYFLPQKNEEGSQIQISLSCYIILYYNTSQQQHPSALQGNYLWDPLLSHIIIKRQYIIIIKS